MPEDEEVRPVEIRSEGARIIWRGLGWSSEYAAGEISPNGSFSLKFTEEAGTGIHRGRFTQDGKTFNMLYESYYCKRTAGRRYAGPGICKPWPADATAQVERELVRVASEDQGIQEYDAFWDAYAGRFAGAFTGSAGKYEWNGSAWKKTGDDSSIRFLFEDGSEIQIFDISQGGPRLQLDHPAWTFVLDSSFQETFSLDGRWARGADTSFMSPEWSSNTPIGSWSQTSEMEHSDTYRITFEGFDLFAYLSLDADAILRFNGAERTISREQQSSDCPELRAEVEAMVPDPERFVDLEPPRRALSFAVSQ